MSCFLRTFSYVFILKRALFPHSKHVGRNRIRVHRATNISCRIQPRASAPLVAAASFCRRLPSSSGCGTKVSAYTGKRGCLFNNVLLFIVASPSEIEQLLFDMHLWAYFGMLKMGILCAVLMRNEGHHAKRCAMLDLGPKLLSSRILLKAKELLTQVIWPTLY